MRVARSERGGNDIFTGRTLFVGCPLGARPVPSARFGDGSTFAFLVVLDATGFSPSESDSAFRLLEPAARFGGIDKNVAWVAQGFNKEQRGRERTMTKLRKMDITRRNASTSASERTVCLSTHFKFSTKEEPLKGRLSSEYYIV